VAKRTKFDALYGEMVDEAARERIMEVRDGGLNYDPDTDVYWLGGVKIVGEILRNLGDQFPEGEPIIVTRRGEQLMFDSESRRECVKRGIEVPMAKDG